MTAAKIAGATDATEENSKFTVEKSASERIIDWMNNDDSISEPDEPLELPSATSDAEPVKEEVVVEETTEEPETAPGAESETKEEKSEEEDSDKDEDSPEVKIDDWPETAKARVAEETRKRKERTEQRDRALTKAAELETKVAALESQLSQVSRPVPTAGDPLADVYDERSLARVEDQFEKIIELAETNPDGAYDVVIGVNHDGTEKKKDFTREELVKMKLVAERGLRKDIPQRRVFLAQRDQCNAQAVEIYADYAEKNSERSQFVNAVVAQDPGLESRIGPEFKIWLGHAYEGRAMWLARQNGKSTTSKNDSVRKIVTAKRTTIAPSTIKQRGDLTVSVEKELAAAKKEMDENPTEENKAKWFKILREAKARRQGAVS